MASNTPTLILRKPDPTDIVDVITDLDANYDKIDAALPLLAKRNRLRVSRAAVQAVGSGVDSAIIWTAREYDTSPGQTMWNAVNPSRLVAPVAGVYNVQFGAQFAIVATAGARALNLLRNNGVIQCIGHFYPNSLWYAGGVITVDVQLGAGDYIECMAYHNAGVVMNVDNVYAIWATMSMGAIA